MNDKRINLLSKEPINKAVRTLALPAIIGLLVMAIYNVVDSMFVAWLGTEATGATQVVLPIVMMISAIGLGFGIGGGSYLSRLLGNKNYAEAHRVTTVSVISSFIIGIIFTIFSLSFIEPLLSLFGANDDVMNMSIDYGRFILIGSAFQMTNMTLNNLLRGEGSAKMSMIGLATGAILNIILDPILIFGFDMGVSGAAIATTFSQIVSFIILMSIYLRKKTISRLSLTYFKPSKQIYNEISKIGIPTILRQLLFSVSIALLNNGAVAVGGSDLLAAIGIVFRVTMVPMYIIFGLGQGFQPVVGYNYGSKDITRVKDALKYSIRITLVISIIGGLIIYIFAPQFMDVFKASDSVKELGIRGLRFLSFGIIIMSFTNTIGVFYQAIGKGKQALILSISRQGIFFVPSVLILPVMFGADGILITQPVADILTLILTLFIFIPYIKNRKLEEEMELVNE